jgi:diguanylate cyclase (GGDEF)-like protein
MRTATLLAIVILTTTVFSGLLYREYYSLTKYMAYIAENGKSALFHEEYINQRMAFTLSTAFSATVAPVAGENDPATVCQKNEQANGVYGLNLTDHTFAALPGTLQTRDPDCSHWATDVPELASMLNGASRPSPRYSFSNYTGYGFDNLRYYIDLDKNYVYINRLIDTRRFRFQNWLERDGSAINIDTHAISLNIGKTALSDLHQGNNIVSHIYKDTYTHKNIISTLNPVFFSGKIKGVIVTDFTIDDLATSFYTAERPVLWSFLTIFVKDNRSGEIIQFHQPSWSIVPITHYQTPMTVYYTLNVSLDMQYFLLSQLWLIALYIVTTLLLCQYARHQLARHATLAHDNITDPLTGLFNRKILTPQLDDKLRSLLAKQISVMAIAVDCDGLKRINDTLGHHMGDEAIKILGNAIGSSLRKSDYAIRSGGDEFNIILIDANLNKAREVIQRITDKLQQTDKHRLVAFSWGGYQMLKQDTVEAAFIKADALMYEQKQGKLSPRDR